MADARHLEITVDGAGHGRVVVDGEDISNVVTELIVVARPGTPGRGTTVVTTGEHGKVDVQVGTRVGIAGGGAGVARLRPADEKAMIALGWTPPTTGGLSIPELVQGLEVGDRVEILREEGGLNVALTRDPAFLRTEKAGDPWPTKK